MAQVVECLSIKPKALSTIFSTTNCNNNSNNNNNNSDMNAISGDNLGHEHYVRVSTSHQLILSTRIT
jgi:hypothetical protein